MTPDEMAHLHATAFAGQGRAWGEREFAGLLQSGHVFVVGDSRAFAVVRALADEAEVLTLATHPDHRRDGFAQSVLSLLETEAARRGATRLFLEVAEDNAAARALYAGAGYRETARRAKYYARPDGVHSDALILEKHLR